MFGSRKRLSDEAYVEEIRRRVSAVQRVRPVFLVIFLLMVCLVIFVLYTVPRMISNMPYERVMVYSGIFMGMAIGLLFFTYVALAASHLKRWLDLRQGFRTEKLMLDYHDRLKAAGALAAAPDRPDSPPYSMTE